MNRRLEVTNRKALPEARQVVASSRDRADWQRAQAVVRFADGQSAIGIAGALGHRPDRVRRLVRRFRARGVIALGDGRARIAPRFKVGPALYPAIVEAVTEKEPPGGGLWTAPKLRRWLLERYHVDVSVPTAGRIFHRADLSRQISRPVMREPLRRSRRASKKGAPGNRRADCWSQSRIGRRGLGGRRGAVRLIPTQRRLWARRGRRPNRSQRRRYQWSCLYGFVHPASGSMQPYIVPCVSAEAFSAVLQTFAQKAEAGPRRQVVVVLDGAGWHVAKDLRVPEHVHLVFLPPYSKDVYADNAPMA